MLNFTVNPRLESVFNWYLHGIGCIILPLNLFTLYLIYTKTPKHSQTYRYYLLNMQIWSTLTAFHVGVLFLPMPLFPLVGGYCDGLLCRAGLPAHYSIVIGFFVIAAIFISMGMSIFYRHQLIMPEGHWLRIGKTRLLLLFSLFALSVQVSTITLFFATPDNSDGVHFLEESIVIYPTAFCSISVHLYRGIARVNFMSLKTRNLHKHIVLVLIAPVSILCIFHVAPILIVIFAIWTENLTHEMTLPFVALVVIYSWTHSTVLIVTTPSFRKAITEPFLVARKSAKPLLQSEDLTMILV